MKWLHLTYKSTGRNFDSYILTGLSTAEIAEFTRNLFVQELECPENLIFSFSD